MDMNHNFKGLAAVDCVIATGFVYNRQCCGTLVGVVLVGHVIFAGINDSITILDSSGNGLEYS